MSGILLPKPKPVEAAHLDAEAVWRVVQVALNGDTSLHDLMNVALFGRTFDFQDELQWGNWPQHAVEAWDLAVKLYIPRHRAKLEDELLERVTLEQAWECVEAAVPEGESFPHLPHVRNHQIPTPAGVGTRAFMRALIQKQGWQFAGRKGSRRVVRAPCVECGRVVRAIRTLDRRCAVCRTA